MSQDSSPIFNFSPELFEVRAHVMEILSENQIEWFSDYKAIDITHDDYGIEIEGIPSKQLADDIYQILWNPIKKYIQPCQCSIIEDKKGWRVDFYRNKTVTKGWSSD